jgi:hypothetical protein
MPNKLARNPANSEVRTGEDRRSELRYKFGAGVELTDIVSGQRRDGFVSDLSLQGCYVDLSLCFPLGTEVKMRITKNEKSVQGTARVVFAQAGDGMGLLFTSIAASDAAIVRAWVAASRETSWLAANRRRTQRIFLQLPVRVTAPAGGLQEFQEEVNTVSISALGALVLLESPVKKGQPLILANIKTGSSVECIVTYIGEPAGKFVQVGMSFVLPNSKFWPVSFPPKDWTSQNSDAKQPLARNGRS